MDLPGAIPSSVCFLREFKDERLLEAREKTTPSSSAANQLMPINIFRKNRKTLKAGFFGDFASWKEAQKETTGYEKPDILAKTELSMRDILSGRAPFERDSVLMQNPEYPWPLISCLLSVAFASQGRLSVLDFGGALGSSYYQCRPFIQSIPELGWAVVEQEHYVDSGRREFALRPVTFYQHPAEACLAAKPNLLLLSSVLPYLPDPYQKFRELLELRVPQVVVDRTFFLRRPGERLTVQVVPEWIYPASYPAWFLDEAKLKAIAREAGYVLVAEFPALDENHPEGEKAQAKGFFWKLTVQSS